MDTQVFIQFSGEMQKAAADSGVRVLTGLGLLAGASAARDAYHARGLSKDLKELRGALKGEGGHEMVSLRKYMKARDPGVTVVDTPQKVTAFLEREKIKGLRGFMTRRALTSMVQQGSNAAAYRGQNGDYIFGRGRLPKAVADHEHGHILDFRAKGIKLDGSPRMGEYVRGHLDAMLQQYSKDRFMKGRYRAETEAWKHVEGLKGKIGRVV